jgi:hemerythrin superfamily protein
MARKSKSPTKRRRSNRTARAKSKSTSPRQDAIALLKADHRQVEQWFEEFDSSRSDSKKAQLARQICSALKAHTTIEEEIFYPAFLEATDDEDIHHEAEIEHDGAKKLIAEIEATGSSDDYFDARVTVLSEMIKHHVREEEQRDGMFAKARSSKMDLAALGEQLAARKAQLTGETEGDEEAGSRRRSRASSAAEGAMMRLSRRVRGE